MDSLKDKTVKFMASSDDAECTTNYLDAVAMSANTAMHNLTDLIGTTKSYSEAVAFYNLFSQPLQASYEAVLSQQVDDMLSEMKDVLATKGRPGSLFYRGPVSYEKLKSLSRSTGKAGHCWLMPAEGK